MPAYHSAFNESHADAPTVCNCAVLPLKTKAKGPAPNCPAGESDIIDEAITLFRANVMFRNFEMLGTSDRALCYLTAFIAQVIRECKRYKTKGDAEKAMFSYTKTSPAIPGDSAFQMQAFFSKPESSKERDDCRAYLRQLREETALRTVQHIYNDDGTPSKWWFSFHKRKFMNIASV